MTVPTVIQQKPSADDAMRFVDDPDYMYQDFAKQRGTSGVKVFRVQDYSWENHGYSLANEIYMEIATLLDNKFETTKNLTYYT